MARMFGVAAAAAATAFLYPAAAQAQAQVSPAVQTAAATPATAQPAVIRTLPDTALGQADTAPAAGRMRPDRADEAAPAIAGTVPGATAAPRRSLADLVADNESGETRDAQDECLARAVYFESRGEPLEGQLAVAEVILNRVRSGRFRSTICEVVTQPSQFSFVRHGEIPDVPRDSSAWSRSVAIAHIAQDGLAEVTGDESLFFHAAYVSPRWGRPRIARIGNHIFYR